MYRKHEGHVTFLDVEWVVLHVVRAYKFCSVLAHEDNVILTSIVNVIVHKLCQWAGSELALAVDMNQISRASLKLRIWFLYIFITW